MLSDPNEYLAPTQDEKLSRSVCNSIVFLQTVLVKESKLPAKTKAALALATSLQPTIDKGIKSYYGNLTHLAAHSEILQKIVTSLPKKLLNKYVLNSTCVEAKTLASWLRNYNAQSALLRKLAKEKAKLAKLLKSALAKLTDAELDALLDSSPVTIRKLRVTK